MVELTIDGRLVEVEAGSMVMHAAHKLGVYVPHFCYHKKLSIAANCRMCLVEVEKAPKAMPACATPATNGMVVHTCSERAIAAQKSVMEFLLINHPLDCPICDQGGECQLQDLAVGYGGSTSRYQEEKRVVFHKDLGPLVSAEEMSRCIHCTRCVRFGQEVAGVMELGMIGRGEHSEITTFVGRSVESELSGNMIDLCPVGALTSKPFRYSARTWELARRRTVSPHDSLGANLVIQVKDDEVMRVVPFENEDINECWISDRDRFSYEGLNAEDRLSTPMIKGEDGLWRQASWSDALQVVAHGLMDVRDKSGAAQIGALASESATLEEMSLLARVTRGLGSENIDFRLRQTDTSLDAALSGAPWLGMPIAGLELLDRVLVVDSFLRKDHPLMAQRLRQAVKRGTQVSSIDASGDDPLFKLSARATVLPAAIADTLAQVAVALATLKAVDIPSALVNVSVDAQAQKIAESLASGTQVAVLLGNSAVNAPDASRIAANAQLIAQLTAGKLGFLTAGANTVGGYLAGATPGKDGKTATAMFAAPLEAYLVLHAEPLLDADDGAQAVKALKAAFSVALTSYASTAKDWATVMLPVSPFTETSGTFINAQGLPQSFKGTVAPFAQTRPAWKVLRVLGNVLHLAGFDDETSESVRDAVLSGGVQTRLSNQILSAAGFSGAQAVTTLQRVTDVPIYRTDAIVRRAPALQASQASRSPVARMHAQTMTALGIAAGEQIHIQSASGQIKLAAEQDNTLASGAIRVAAGFEQTAALGSAFGQLSVERV